MEDARIDHIVSLLQDFAPNEIISLRKQFPNHVEMLKAGNIMGNTEGDDLLILKMKICIAGLKLVNEKCKALMPEIKQKIKQISRFQLIGQYIVALSSTAILTLLEKEGYELIKYFSSILVLLGSIINIYVQHKTNSTSNQSSLFSVYSNLNENFIQSEQQLLELEIMTKINLLDENSKNELKRIIQSANSTCLQISKLLSNYL